MQAVYRRVGTECGVTPVRQDRWQRMNNTKRVCATVVLAGAVLAMAGPAAQAADGPGLPVLSRITAMDPAGPGFLGPTSRVTAMDPAGPFFAGPTSRITALDPAGPLFRGLLL